MLTRYLILLVLLGLALVVKAGPARAQDVETCFATADRLANGEQVTPDDKRAGHEACQRALGATSSVVQKYQIQEFDVEIVGHPPQKSK